MAQSEQSLGATDDQVSIGGNANIPTSVSAAPRWAAW